MKFYFVKFVHNISNKHFYKFGITKQGDVLNRFNTSFDIRYSEFNISVIFSVYCSESQAQKLESIFLKNNPKNFILEDLVNVKKSYYSNLSGITECFIADDNYIKDLIFNLYRIKSILQSKKLI